jgi:hypothetical protein
MIFWCLTSTKLAFLSRRATKFLEVTTQEICYLFVEWDYLESIAQQNS